MKLRLIVAAVSLLTLHGTLPLEPAAAATGADAPSATARKASSHDPARTAGRRDCPLGKVYSSFHRRCVWWLPRKT